MSYFVVAVCICGLRGDEILFFFINCYTSLYSYGEIRNIFVVPN